MSDKGQGESDKGQEESAAMSAVDGSSVISKAFSSRILSLRFSLVIYFVAKGEGFSFTC